MIQTVTNENDFETPVYIFLKLRGDADIYAAIDSDILHLNAKFLSFDSGADAYDILGDSTWVIMEEDDIDFFAIKHGAHIRTIFTGEEMDLLVPRIRQETVQVLLTLGKIAYAIELNHISDITEFLEMVEGMTMLTIVHDYLRSTHFL